MTTDRRRLAVYQRATARTAAENRRLRAVLEVMRSTLARVLDDEPIKPGCYIVALSTSPATPRRPRATPAVKRR